MIDPQQSRIIELRYLGGLTIEETADVVNLSRTVAELTLTNQLAGHPRWDG